MKEKLYQAKDLRKLGVSSETVKNLFYREGWEKRGVFMTTIELKVKVINQETFDKRIKPLLERKKKKI